MTKEEKQCPELEFLAFQNKKKSKQTDKQAHAPQAPLCTRPPESRTRSRDGGWGAAMSALLMCLPHTAFFFFFFQAGPTFKH